MRESSEAFVALQYQGFLGRVELPGKRRHGGTRGFAALEQLGETKVVEPLAAGSDMEPARHEHRIEPELNRSSHVGADAVADGEDLAPRHVSPG